MAGSDESPLDLVAMLGGHAARRPDAPCLIFEAERISFAALDARSDLVAGALREAGLGSGERVLILAPASPVFFELLFGCAKADTIMVPVNARLSPREVADIVADAQPALVIRAEALASLLPDDPAPQVVAFEQFDAWRDRAAPADDSAVADPDTPVLILYTSGTTARAKGVVLSHRNLSYLGRMAKELWGFTQDSVNLAAMPLFHIGGIGYGLLALSQGGATVLTRESDPAALVELLSRHDVTHTFFVPTLIQRVVEHMEATGTTTPSLRHMVYGAAPIGETLLARALSAFGCGFHHAYGMTETAGTVVTLAPEHHDPQGPHRQRLRSCGRPMPWVELKLVDPATGQEVPTGEIGEVRLRSPAITAGYWRRSDATAEAITADGWLCTGDAAELDADGFLYLRDRYKDMILSGGENIYPAEIDNVIQHHPAVSEVAVIGVPHEKWGETPRAYVVLRTGETVTEKELIGFTRERLAHYKCPTSVHFVEELPRNASGKILKRELRQ